MYFLGFFGLIFRRRSKKWRIWKKGVKKGKIGMDREAVRNFSLKYLWTKVPYFLFLF